LLYNYKLYYRVYINNIIITFNSIKDYFKYLDTIFNLFISKNIVFSPKKSYLAYPNIELLSFYVNGFGLSTTKNRIKTFKKLTFPNNLKAFEQYISNTKFLRHLIPYYIQFIKLL
ncbi:hypothetical protein GE21DRAFT_1211261, partial [Neurospora crassa]